MVANTLYFFDEVQKAPSSVAVKTTKQELDLAKNLIEQMTFPFQPEKYKDEYHIKLKKAIKQKINGKEIVEAKEDRAPTKIINLMEALQKSLDVNNGKKKAE